jgi:hypothetical protein
MFDGINWVSYTDSNSGLAENGTFSIAVDEQNKMWFGGEHGNISVLDGSNWTVYDTLNFGYVWNEISDIKIDKQGNKWFRFGDGIAEFDGNNWTLYINEYGYIDTYNSTRIAIDAQNNKWFTGWGISSFCESNVNVQEPNREGIFLYPNPFDRSLTIHGAQPETPVSVYSVQGNLLYTFKACDNEPIDFSNLATGIYIAKINGKSYKFVKK